MQEVCLNVQRSILEIPTDTTGKVFGIVLPTAKELTKDGLILCDQYDTNLAAKYFKIDRVASEYYKKYGARVFYLGAVKNPSNGVMKLFNFPIKNSIRDKTDATVVSQSCEQLLSTLEKFKVDCCLLPFFGADLGIASFANCIRPIMDVMFDERFIMVHRKEN